MNTIPKFSICIPNYNYGHLIGKTIQSVINQSYQNFEIIVADNCSTDNSVSIIKSFKDNRIKLIQNEINIGFTNNLQQVTKNACGDYINLLSSDDIMKPEALQSYYKAITKIGHNSQNIVFMSDVCKINSRGEFQYAYKRDTNSFIKTIKYTNSELNRIDYDNFSIYDGDKILKSTLSKLRNFASFLTVVYSKNLYDKVEGYNSNRLVGPDKHFNYKLLFQGIKVCYIHAPLFEYRVHTTLNNISQNTNLKQQIDDYLYTIEYEEDLLERFNLKKDDLINTFINEVSLKKSLSALANGQWLFALRSTLFCLSAYPLKTAFNIRFLLLVFFIILGPLSIILAKPLYRMYKFVQSD